jgi:hypothetical protein
MLDWGGLSRRVELKYMAGFTLIALEGMDA